MHSVGLIYLSLTGNTKAITERMAERFSEGGYTVSLYDLMDADNRRRFPLAVDPEFLARNDVLGFGCFSSVYQPMFFFRRLLSAVRGLQEKSCFVYCTYGVEVGATLTMMRSALRRSRAAFLGGAAFACSDEVKELLLSGMYFHHDRPTASDLDSARQFASRIMSNHQKWRAGTGLSASEVDAPRGRPFFRLLARCVYRQGLVKRLRRFTIDETRCIRCGWCVDICPSLSLSLPPGSAAPVVGADCQGCAMCFDCRQGAVRPAITDFAVRMAGRWARTFYGAAARKILDDREIAALREDRFTVMKSRPELMSRRG